MEGKDPTEFQEKYERPARLRKVSGAHFEISNYCSGLASLLTLLPLIIASVHSIQNRIDPWTPVIMVGLMYTAWIARYIADTQKARGDEILRLVEFENGLGWLTPPRVYSEYVDDASWLVQWLAKPSESPGEYYWASKTTPSPIRFVENIRESAWWSKRLSSGMVLIETVLIIFIAGIALLIFRAAIHSGTSSLIPEDITELAVAALTFLLTKGPLTRVLGFRRFRTEASRIVERAELLLKDKRYITEADAIEIAGGYHIIRKGSPRIPSWWWKIRRNRLNKAMDRIMREEAQSG